MIQQDFEQKWKAALHAFEVRFDQEVDLQGALFLIGVNELGSGPRKFSKDEKIDILHLAVCRLLEPYGFYVFHGVDKDGWPHYERTERLPHLQPGEQEQLIKEAVITYTQEW